MFPKKLKFIGVIIILQIALISYLARAIYFKKQTQFIPLDKNNYPQTIKSNYKYYYEPIIGNYNEPIPNSWGEGAGKIIKYGINQDTLRANKEYSLKKDRNTIRIISIGDSFTFGQRAEDADVYPRQLENKLNSSNKKKYEVINLGVPGFDTAYAVERYRLRGDKYNPDYVLWFLIEDDFTNIAELERGFAEYFKKHLTESEREKYKKIFGNEYLEEAMGSNEVFKRLTSEEILKKSIEEVNKLSKILGKKLIIITFEQLDNKYKNELKKTCLKNKCKVFDKLPNIYKDKTLYFPDKHPNKYGYKKIVDVLYQEIIKL